MDYFLLRPMRKRYPHIPTTHAFYRVFCFQYESVLPFLSHQLLLIRLQVPLCSPFLDIQFSSATGIVYKVFIINTIILPYELGSKLPLGLLPYLDQSVGSPRGIPRSFGAELLRLWGNF